MAEIQLGAHVRDVISGLEGIATGRAIWLFTTPRIWVESRQLLNGQRVDGCWVEESQLVEVDSAEMMGFK